MTQQVFAYIVYKDDVIDDSAAELATAAQKILPDAPVTAVVFGSGANLDAVCNAATDRFAEVWRVDNETFAYPNAEIIRKALINLIPNDAVLLLAHDTFGMDLAPGLSIKLNSAFVSDVVDIEGLEGDTLHLVRQEYSGMVSTHVKCDMAEGLVMTCRPGSFQPGESPSVGGQVMDKSAEVGDLSANRRYIEVVEAEIGDVDITKSDVLVSVGRGIEDEDNIEVAEELADAIGAVVSCSRPIVDAKWLEKSRQVGTSGKTVKPKVYIALGISGSFQHMGGIKGSPFIVAVNKNPKAPIFQVADVGVVDDLLDFVPELTDKIKEG